ncbi:MAG: enoyl-CoA hydratase/isomerase family protein [Bacteroidota bacterium]
METLLYRKDGEIARIIMNRPDRLNAYNSVMLREMKTLLEEITADDSIKVVILSGAGRAFSAGVDLKVTDAEGFQKESFFMEVGDKVMSLFVNMPKVTIAQVHGYCFTGALEMMLFTDLVFCTEDTQFGDTHAKWSLIPRWGMSQRLSRRVGLVKAKELTFRAMRINGVEAERIGLVNRAFKAEELEAEVNKIVAEITGNSFEAIKAIKKLYDDGYATTLKEGLAIEMAADTKLSNTDEQLGQFAQKKFRN